MGASAGGIKMGRAFIVIDALDQTDRVLQNVAAKFQKAGEKLQGFGMNLLIANAPATLQLKSAVNQFMEFDDAMRLVEARSRGTAGEMEDLRNQAKQLGKETAFTTTQMGNLMSEFARGGMSRKDILGATPGALNLALANPSGNRDQDMSDTAKVITQILVGFKMAGSEASRVADMLAQASTEASFSLNDMAVSAEYFPTVARTFNTSLEKSIALITMLKKGLGSASMAGTALRNMELMIGDKDKRAKVNAAMAKAGRNEIEFVDKATGKFNSLDYIIGSLSKNMQGLTDVQVTDILGEMFETRTMAGALLLKDSLKEFPAILARITNSSGKGQKMIDIVMGGIGGSWERMVSSLEQVKNRIGETLAPVLIKLFELTDRILDQIDTWIEMNPGLVASVAGIVAGLTTLAAAAFLVGTALKVLSFAFLPLSLITSLISGVISGVTGLIGFLGVLGPVGVFITGVILGLAAAFATLLVFNWSESTKAIGEFFSSIWTQLGQMADTINTTFQGVTKALAMGDAQLAMKIGLAGLNLLWNQFIDMLMTPWRAFQDWLRNTWNDWSRWWVDKMYYTLEVIAVPLNEMGAISNEAMEQFYKNWKNDTSPTQRVNTKNRESQGTKDARKGLNDAMNSEGMSTDSEHLRHAKNDLSTLQQEYTTLKEQRDGESRNTRRNALNQQMRDKDAEIKAQKELIAHIQGNDQLNNSKREMAKIENRKRRDEDHDRLLKEKGSDEFMLEHVLGGPKASGKYPLAAQDGKKDQGKPLLPFVPAIEGLEKGTIAAAKQAYENAQRRTDDGEDDLGQINQGIKQLNAKVAKVAGFKP